MCLKNLNFTSRKNRLKYFINLIDIYYGVINFVYDNDLLTHAIE